MSASEAPPAEPIAPLALVVDEKPTRMAKIRRKSPLEQPMPRNQLKQGYFAITGASDKDRKYMTPSELCSFFRHLPTTSFWYPYFYIQYIYGCRLSEPALILDKDVNVKKGVIVIRRLKKAQEKDGYREYVYSADKRVLDCVDVAKRWKTHKHIEKNPFLFASNRKLKTVGAERLSQLRSLNGWQAVSRFTAHRMFQRVTTSLRFAVELRQSHVLRHTRAVMMLAAGAPPEQVQKLLGHATLRMTARYEEAAQNVRSQLSAEFLNMGLGL